MQLSSSKPDRWVTNKARQREIQGSSVIGHLPGGVMKRSHSIPSQTQANETEDLGIYSAVDHLNQLKA
jgi:hypothetical protein